MIYKDLKEEKEESGIMSSGVASQNIDLFFKKEKKNSHNLFSRGLSHCTLHILQ